jgi:hypothetical protein
MWRWWEFQTSEVDAKIALVDVGPYNFACRQIFKERKTFINTGS